MELEKWMLNSWPTKFLPSSALDQKFRTVVLHLKQLNANKKNWQSGIHKFDLHKVVRLARFLSHFRLLDFEHRASKQIPLLLKLGQEPQALTKAVESGDPNLIYKVLVVMKENYSADKFYMTIRHYPSVNALYAKLCRTVQMGSLEQIYEQEDNFNAQAILSVKDSYRAQVCSLKTCL